MKQNKYRQRQQAGMKQEEALKKLSALYVEIAPRIHQRISEFRSIIESGNKNKIFAELVYCIMTPQSNAHSCRDALLRLKSKKLLLNGNARLVEKYLAGVRFHHTKAKRIVFARSVFPEIYSLLHSTENITNIRNKIIKKVPGLGYKESSHFLRNIGLGQDIAILDRHIQRNLLAFGLISSLPKIVTGKIYLKMENTMRRWSKEIGIPMDDLDLLLWFREKGEIFM